jgi:hypothetical protein
MNLSSRFAAAAGSPLMRPLAAKSSLRDPEHVGVRQLGIMVREPREPAQLGFDLLDDLPLRQFLPWRSIEWRSCLIAPVVRHQEVVQAQLCTVETVRRR